MKHLAIVALACGALAAVAAVAADAPKDPKPEDVPALIRQLSAAAAKDRLAACAALRALGDSKEARNAVAPLLDVVKSDSDPGVRAAAAGALGRIGGAAGKATPVLLDRLKKEKDHAATLAALEALQKFGPAAQAASPQLREMLKKAQDDVAAAEKAVARAKKDGDAEKEKAANSQLSQARELEDTVRAAYVSVIDNK